MFNYLIHPITKQKISLFSTEGKLLLKQYVRLVQIGGGCEHQDLCTNCMCECKLMGDYGSPASNVTKRTFNKCVKCADNEMALHKGPRDNAKLLNALECAENAKKLAASGNIKLTYISNQSNPENTSSNLDYTCKGVLKNIRLMLEGLNANKRFTVSLNTVYMLLLSSKKSKSKSLIRINPDYAIKYKELKNILQLYNEYFEKHCTITTKIHQSLFNIFKYFIDVNNTDGGTSQIDLNLLPTAPTFNPETPIDLNSLPIAPSKTPERPTARNRQRVAILSGSNNVK
jgi:F0F1-type ATP synthase delta subunit